MNEVTVVTASIPPRAGFLREAVASVINQTITPAAHVVTIDVGCAGEAVSRNRALMGVDTEWVAFLDDDDILYPHHLEVLLKAAEESGAEVIYPWFEVLGGTDPFPEAFGREFDEASFRTRTFVPVTVLVKTDWAQRHAFPVPGSEAWVNLGLDPGSGMGPDWGFFLALLNDGARFHHVPERTWVWRHHSSNTSGRPWTQVRF